MIRNIENTEMLPVGSASPPIDWNDWLMKAGLTGVTAALAAYVVTGDNAGRTINVLGMDLPGVAVIGLGGAAGSLTADMAHQWIFPLIPNNEKYDRAEAAALSVGAAGAGCYIASSLLGPSPALLPSIAIGSGSFIASDYVYHNFVSAKSGGLLF